MMGKSRKKGQKGNRKGGNQKERKGKRRQKRKKKRKKTKRKKIRSLAEATGHDASFQASEGIWVGAVCATAARFFFFFFFFFLTVSVHRIFRCTACVTPKKSNVHLSPRTLKPSQRPSSGRRDPPTKYHLPVACSSPSPNQGVTTTPASHASCGFGRGCDGGFAWASAFVQRLWWNPR
ncbi:hypothetical protein HDV62DRAFT_74505 [Trichoderma sp. SZMC 28011]